jgi:hypothetical protein
MFRVAPVLATGSSQSMIPTGASPLSHVSSPTAARQQPVEKGRVRGRGMACYGREQAAIALAVV